MGQAIGKARNTSKLLLHEQPLQVLPALAVAVGLNEAIILQQLHYWLNKKAHTHDGRDWHFNRYVDWQKQFPFWSVSTIKRTMVSLEKQGVIFTANYNNSPIDKTKWYAINYEKLNSLCEDATDQNEPSMAQVDLSTDQNEPSMAQVDLSTDQNELLDGSSWSHQFPETNSEITHRDLHSLPPTPSVGEGESERECVRNGHGEAAQAMEAALMTYSPGFTALCAAYPADRQEGIAEAWQTWYARDLEPRTPEIVGKVKHAIATIWQGRERRFIPLLKTWLDKSRYNDRSVDVATVPKERYVPEKERRTVETAVKLAQKVMQDGTARAQTGNCPDGERPLLQGPQ